MASIGSQHHEGLVGGYRLQGDECTKAPLAMMQFGGRAMKLKEFTEAEHAFLEAYTLMRQLSPRTLEKELCETAKSLKNLEERRGRGNTLLIDDHMMGSVLILMKVCAETMVESRYHHSEHILQSAYSILSRLPWEKGKIYFCPILKNLSILQHKRGGRACACKRDPLLVPITAPPNIWNEVITVLSWESKWEVVNMLMSNCPQPSGGNFGVNQGKVNVNGAAKGCGGQGIDVGKLLSDLSDEDLATWGVSLAVDLLEEGASMDTVNMGSDGFLLHWAVKLGLQSVTRNRKLAAYPRDHCDICASRLFASRELCRKSRASEALAILCSIICADKHKSGRHKYLAEECLREVIIIFLSSGSEIDVPECMMELTEDTYQTVVRRLAQNNQWEQVDRLIRHWRESKPHSKTIAEEISIQDLMQYDFPHNSPVSKLEVVTSLFHNGATLSVSNTNTGDIIKIAVAKKEFRVIQAFILHGAQPKHIQMFPGDRPLHVALRVALELDKGYFELLESLLGLFDKDKETYDYLDPECKDSFGHSLEHIASNCKHRSLVKRAKDLLCNPRLYKVEAGSSFWNQLDYFTSQDERQKPKKPTHEKNTSRRTKGERGAKRATVEKRRHKDTIAMCISEISLVVERKANESSGEVSSNVTSRNRYVKSRADTGAESPDAKCSINTCTAGLHNCLNDQAQNGSSGLEEDGIYPDVDTLTWEVEYMPAAFKFFKGKSASFSLKETVKAKVMQLANGEWIKSATKLVPNVPSTLKLFEAKISKGSRIIWELAVSFSPRLSGHECTDTEATDPIYSEVIRVWDVVLDHDNLHDSIEKITRSHSKGRQAQLHTTLFIYVDHTFPADNSKQRLPKQFKVASANTPGCESIFQPASPNKNEYTVAKAYSLSSALLSRLLLHTDTIVDYPFKVSEQEHYVIGLKIGTPLLLQGRSGTGKTTCCLYRLWNSYRTYWSKVRLANGPLLSEEGLETSCQGSGKASNAIENDENGACFDKSPIEPPAKTMVHIRQIFVTKNAILCNEVKKKFQHMCEACPLLCGLQTRDDKSLPSKLKDITDDMYPLFITSRNLLRLLDESLPGKHFFKRSVDGNLGRDILDLIDTESWMSFTPVNTDRDTQRICSTGKANRVAKQKSQREVTYHVFAEELWPKMSKRLPVKEKKGNMYHPSLVWTEINSFIKGSFEALCSGKGHLTLAEYEDIGKRRAPNFRGKRKEVYDIFLCYEKVKRDSGFFDECDLIFNIYKRLHDSHGSGWTVHQIYVDETQDFIQAELCLLIALCQNPNEMFLTGDTAQAIMRGVSFRFCDLQSLFLYAQGSLRMSVKQEAIKVPGRFYQITHNYRSHEGILSLACSIVDLMTEFFPDTFDQLEKDRGFLKGPIPVLLETCRFSDMAVLLRGNQRQTSDIEFGAHQAILVTNDLARKSLPKELKDGLVLTIGEAKGLEFDDILIYNFFKDSEATKEWRALIKFLRRKYKLGKLDKMATGSACNNGGLVELSPGACSASRPVDFDGDQHSLLCSELKNLYTAVTRARVNVWIFDEDTDNRAPMFGYFKALGLVRTVSPIGVDSSVLQEEMFVATSCASDWLNRGDDFMKHSLYEVAAKCYRKAGSREKEDVALAHAAASLATHLQDQPARMKEEFLNAAEIFLVKCGMTAEAARCLENAGETLLAARLYEKMGKIETAERLYMLCDRNYYKALKFESDGLYGHAINFLCDLERYDKAVDIFNRYNLKIQEFMSKGELLPLPLVQNRPSTEQTMDRLAYKAAGYHLKRNDEQKMLASLSRLGKVEDRITFLVKYGKAELAADMLKESGCYHQAANILAHEGNYKQAIEFGRMVKDDVLVGRCLLASSREAIRDAQNATVKSSQNITRNLLDELVYMSSMDDGNVHTHLVGHILLLLGELTDWDQPIEYARLFFEEGKPTSNEAGKVECTKLRLLWSNLESNSAACYNFVTKDLACILEVLRIMNNPSTYRDREKVQLYMKLYDVTEYKDQFLLRNANGTETIEIDTTKSDETKATVESYILNLLKQWVSTVRSSCTNILEGNTLCPEFAQGRPCNQSPICKHRHEPHTKSTFWNTYYCLLCQVHVDAKILTTYNLMKGEDVRLQLRKLLPLDEYASLQKLIKFILPTTAHWTLFCCTAQDGSHTKAIFKFLQNDEIQQQIAHWQVLQRKKAELEFHVSETAAFLDTFLQRGILLSNTDLFDVWMMKAERTSRLTLKESTLDFGQVILEAVRFLYGSKADPVKSLSQFEKYLDHLSKSGDACNFPEFGNFFFIFEFFLMVYFQVCVRHTGNYCTVPSSYVSVVEYLDASFGQHLPLKNVVEKFPLCDPRNVLKGTISTMIGILIGRKENRFSLLSEVFQHSGKHIESGIAERCWVLCLTLLCNVSEMVPESFQKDLIHAFHQPLGPYIALPLRLSSAMKKTRRSNGKGENLEALWAILRERCGEELLIYQWRADIWTGHLHVEPLDFKLYELLVYRSDKRLDTSARLSRLQSQVSIAEASDNESGLTESEKTKLREGAGFVLLRFFRFVMLCKRAKRLGSYMKAQVRNPMQELPPFLQVHFQRCGLDDTMCGICGIDFHRNTSNDSQGPVVMLKRLLANIPCGYRVQRRASNETRASHERSVNHCLRTRDCDVLCEFIKLGLAPTLERALVFLCSREKQSIDLDIDRLSVVTDDVFRELKRIADCRDWGGTEKLHDLTTKLVIQFECISKIRGKKTERR